MINQINKKQREKNLVFKRKNGITLIALVVSIIVLLILAGVSIAMLTGDNGILTRTQTVVERNNASQEEEMIKLAVQSAKVAGQGIITTDNLNKELRECFNNEKVVTENEDYFFYQANYKYIIYRNGEVKILEDSYDGTIIENGIWKSALLGNPKLIIGYNNYHKPNTVEYNPLVANLKRHKKGSYYNEHLCLISSFPVNMGEYNALYFDFNISGTGTVSGGLYIATGLDNNVEPFFYNNNSIRHFSTSLKFGHNEETIPLTNIIPNEPRYLAISFNSWASDYDLIISINKIKLIKQ